MVQKRGINFRWLQHEKKVFKNPYLDNILFQEIKHVFKLFHFNREKL